MFYLFILESIGTSELILIGLVALIVLGPKRLPEVARKIGKTMSDFRQTTNEFKKTWAEEANFDEDIKEFKTMADSLRGNTVANENSVVKIGDSNENKILSPEIKKVNQENFAQNFSKEKIQAARENKTENATGNKQDWL